MRVLADVASNRRLEGIGLTIPGVVSSAGLLEWAPSLDWRDVIFGERVRTRFDVAVYVENDANAAALAEDQLRDATEGDSLLFVLLDWALAPVCSSTASCIGAVLAGSGSLATSGFPPLTGRWVRRSRR